MKANPHILYIEDNEYNQRLTKKILTPAGFRLSQARDGLQGIKMADNLRPDLILMDLDLPYLDGLGVAAKIKSMEGMQAVPIVALTSKINKRDRDKALVVGCDGYIQKPIDAGTFPRQIRTYLEGKREVSSPAERTRLLKDFNLNLIDQLQDKVQELEETNRELIRSKEELQLAYQKSQSWNKEQQRLAKLRENIVTITSHELRTPLSVAIGYIDLLKDGLMGEPNEQQARILEITSQSLGRMRGLVDKITDLTQLSLKKFPLNLEEVDLNASFRKVSADLSIFMSVRSLNLDDQLSENPVSVLADRGLLAQVFLNLLKNAICFTPDGGTITISSWLEGQRAYFSLSDTGIGIAEDELERIFEEFYQVQDVTHHKTGSFEFMTRGIGVGLALCREILYELGGKISANSPGLEKGSTFTFYLPTVQRE